MNTKRKNNNFKTLKNDKKNNTYAIILCVLIFFWTIASFLGTIAFIRSFDNDNTVVASADAPVEPVPTREPQYVDYLDFSFDLFPTSYYVEFPTYTANIADGGLCPALTISFEQGFPTLFRRVGAETWDYVEFTGDFYQESGDSMYDYYIYNDFADVDELSGYVNGIDISYTCEDTGAYDYFNILGYCIHITTSTDDEYYIYIMTYDSYDDVFDIDIYVSSPMLNYYSDLNLYESGYYDGFNQGLYDGYFDGYDDGYNDGYNDGNDDGYDLGYDTGYNEGVSYAKYGPFNNLDIYCTINELEDSDGNIIAGVYDTQVLDVTDFLFTMGFNGIEFARYLVDNNLPANSSTWQYIELIFNFDLPFSYNSYPLRFRGNSTSFSSPVRVVYVDNTYRDYEFIRVAEDNGQVYYYLPIEENNLISSFYWEIYGGYDGFGIEIYVPNVSYNEGYNAGQADGYASGRAQGYNTGYTVGYNAGLQVGKNQGFNEGVASANDYSFLGLLTAVVDAPLKVFYDMFDFEILGYNMSSFFLAVLSICIVIAVVKVILAR